MVTMSKDVPHRRGAKPCSPPPHPPSSFRSTPPPNRPACSRHRRTLYDSGRLSNASDGRRPARPFIEVEELLPGTPHGAGCFKRSGHRRRWGRRADHDRSGDGPDDPARDFPGWNRHDASLSVDLRRDQIDGPATAMTDRSSPPGRPTPPPRRQYSYLLQQWLGSFVVDDAHAEAIRKLRTILGLEIPSRHRKISTASRAATWSHSRTPIDARIDARRDRSWW